MPVLRATGMTTALVAALAAGCGGSDAPELGDPSAALDRAPEATAKAESARVALSATMELEGVEPLEFGGEGVADLDDELSKLELDLSEMAGFQTEGGGSDPDLWRGTVLYTPEGTLMKLPAFNSLTAEPDKWIRWTDDALVREGGTQFTAPDPVELLDFVRSAGADVSVEGGEEIRGVETTHLRTDVAVSGLAQAAEDVEALAYAQRLQTAGVDAFPLDVWLDEDGRIRRIAIRYDDLRVSGSQAADLETTLELYDFGSAGEVTLPPAGEVVDIGDVIGRGPEETEHSEE